MSSLDSQLKNRFWMDFFSDNFYSNNFCFVHIFNPAGLHNSRWCMIAFIWKPMKYSNNDV